MSEWVGNDAHSYWKSPQENGSSCVAFQHPPPGARKWFSAAHLEDVWINEQSLNAPVTQLEDTTIAVDASYYIQQFLDYPPTHEPLLPALGGLTGIETHIEADLDCWVQNNTTPFFIFNGQPVEGQDAVFVQRGKSAISKTDEAWNLYFRGEANQAVSTFGQDRRAFPIPNLFPLLQAILKKRKLHFLVPPFNASAQLAYLDMIESDQCSGIMGSQELLLYPIKDYIIKSIDWDNSSVKLTSKKILTQRLSCGESMFVDALLMIGNTFIPPFPPLLEQAITPSPSYSVNDAANMLRTAEKSVANLCGSFNDVLKRTDPKWLNKYRKAKMMIDHFIYIEETGHVKVHNFDTLTHDNYEYLGYQLPAELFHYLNTGLISARLPGSITHGEIVIPPTLDGVKSEEYRKLIATQLMPVREQTMRLVLPRLNRGISFKPIYVKVWYDDKYSYTIEPTRGVTNRTLEQAQSWSVKDITIAQFFPDAKHGSVQFELNALKNVDFVKSTLVKEKNRGIETPGLVTSLAIWRFLHLRGYVGDDHHLTPWGEALAASLDAISPTVQDHPNDGLADAVLLAFELLRYDLLNTRNQHTELNGLPMNGNDEDKASLLLISRCAILLKLHHEANGYTGPLSKNFLHFRSLGAAVREANRDLVEGLVASMLLFAESKKEREDYLEISQQLPFLTDSDVGLGIAVKTYLDDIHPSDTTEIKQKKLDEFPSKYVPYATDFSKDLQVSFAFFDALHVGIKALGDDQAPAIDRKVWSRAAEYLQARR
ncbi:putative XPG N-terminal domain-containing protein [Seiridium cardinale]|uniref:XPG N-terminal domain-containing protein n=1 Tax=Seiridium cardinale TaxID=138064 RepID=A0ABR2XVR2_9PEZI